jgi:hypothetical protein
MILKFKPNQVKVVKNQPYDVVFEMNDTEEAKEKSQSQSTNQKAIQSTQKKPEFKKNHQEEEEEEEEEEQQPRNYKLPKQEQNVMLFDLNQFQNLNVGSEVKELFSYMKK